MGIFVVQWFMNFIKLNGDILETIILNATNDNIKLCAEVIKQGGLVAIPTETVYGLAANAMDFDAVSSIFAAKGRQPDNPLIVHVSAPEKAAEIAAEIPELFHILVKAFWPGPLTLILKKNNKIPSNVTAGLDTVAVRMPNHPVALSLIEESGCPIAAPSSNISGFPSPTKAVHVKNDLDGKIKFILDGGNCSVGLESTVLDISEGTPRILRPGCVTYDELTSLLGYVEVEASASHGSPRSPGMKYRHYAPNAPLTAVIGPPDATAEYIRANISADKAALMFDECKFDHPGVVTFGTSSDYKTQAAKLFEALRQIDKLGSVGIYAQVPSESGLGQAVANRIKKAAGQNIIEI